MDTMNQGEVSLQKNIIRFFGMKRGTLLHRSPPPQYCSFFKDTCSSPPPPFFFLTLCLISQYLILRRRTNQGGGNAEGRMEMEGVERLQEEEGREGGGKRRRDERPMDGRRRQKERINSSGALVPHYPGRALSPWQCGRKRTAEA